MDRKYMDRRWARWHSGLAELKVGRCKACCQGWEREMGSSLVAGGSAGKCELGVLLKLNV